MNTVENVNEAHVTIPGIEAGHGTRREGASKTFEMLHSEVLGSYLFNYYLIQ